jgi:GNAT superfamily N-acetyltransferase
MSLYADYVKEREEKQVIENEDAFCKYSISEKEKYCYLEDLYVRQESRKTGIGQRMTDFICILAKNKGCKKLITSVVPSAKGSQYSMKVILKYGFKLRSSDYNIIFFEKDL